MSLSIIYPSSSKLKNQTSFRAGTRINIARGLSKNVGNVDIFDGVYQSLLPLRIKRKLYKTLSNKKYMPERSSLSLDNIARKIERQLSINKYDLIFTPDSTVVSHLKTDVPIILFTDAVFDAMIDYYPEYQYLCNETIKDGHDQEQNALDRVSLAIYSSKWAADEAVKYYKVDQRKIKFVPFGANIIDEPPRHYAYNRKIG